MEPLYKSIKQKLNITEGELNIEGALYSDQKLYLFQRGNGGKNKNGIIIITKEIIFFPIILPKIQDVETTFTDAILIEDTIYFLATAEDTHSTYTDGEVLGSIIGTIDLKTMQLI